MLTEALIVSSEAPAGTLLPDILASVVIMLVLFCGIHFWWWPRRQRRRR